MHVCWHRNTSINNTDNHRSLVNQLSGYLLRKFKNSNGWQKLWVVFSNFCLFFYKTYQDEYPLASLPLLGYIITQPSQDDAINREFVFKLKFKNHVYFFRAESQYSYERWVFIFLNVIWFLFNDLIILFKMAWSYRKCSTEAVYLYKRRLNIVTHL